MKAGDSWTVTETLQKGTQGFSRAEQQLTIERTDANDMFVSVKQADSPQAPNELMFGTDWSRTRDVNGTQEVTTRPLAFPLKEGKKWSLDYTLQNPNRAHLSETYHFDYTVIGWEDVQVPAGTFHALKIEADGKWSAVVAATAVTGSQIVATPGVMSGGTVNARSQQHNISGRLYRVYWYVPSQKRYVKSVEEVYDTNGVRTSRYTQEQNTSKLAS
jgi:hypothetical protein